MTLRARFVLYLVLLHVALGLIALLLLREAGPWMLAAEALLVLSLALGFLLVRRLFVPLELIGTGAGLISERDFSSHFLPVGDPEIDRLIAVYNTMIDRLRQERLLAEERHRLLQSIIEVSPAGMVTCDFDGVVTDANRAACEVAGMNRDELCGRRLADIGHPLTDAMAGLEAGGSEVVGVRRRRVRCTRIAFLDRGFLRSAYLLEELTEELRASERSAYEKLIRMMSHEVNNSTGAVGSLLESALHYAGQLRLEDRGDFTQALEIAIGRMRSLDRFMRGFADVVRLPRSERREEELAPLVEDVVTLFRAELAARRIRCTVDVLPLRVSIDKNQIEQVLINVLKNAVEAIGSDGEITIRGGERDGLGTLTVADSGAGIPAESLPMLFSPFYSTKRDGRGVGLTLVREILDQHGFDFTLENRPGGGAEFRVAFLRG